MSDPVSEPRPEEEILTGFQWDDAPVLVVFWLLAFVVFLQFFTRYVLNDSLGWTEEIARYLLIAVTFLGAIMAARKESHIAVELAFRYLPRGARLGLQIVIDAASFVFYAFMAWLCTGLAQNTRQKMVSIAIPKSLLYWFVAVCFLGMAIYALVVLARHLRTRTSRLVDPDRFAVTGPNL